MKPIKVDEERNLSGERVESPSPALAWRPIETAPRGRQAVLGFWPGKPVNGHNYAIMRRTRTGWVDYKEPLNLDYDVTPTHWMPLPDPPLKES